MAVARLSRVTLETPRSELGTVLARVLRFGTFHPTKREGTVQDVGILLLGSRHRRSTPRPVSCSGGEASGP